LRATSASDHQSEVVRHWVEGCWTTVETTRIERVVIVRRRTGGETTEQSLHVEVARSTGSAVVNRGLAGGTVTGAVLTKTTNWYLI
jgi:hypothetical protein